MAGLRKDVELIFRGEDRASPSIKKVRDSVAGLSKAIDDQIAAAAKGEGSVDELAKAYRGLKDAQGDVGEIAKIATAYENQATKIGELGRKIEEAKAKSAGLTAQLAAAEKPSKTLSNQYEASERKLAGLIAKQDQYKAELQQLGASLDAAGGDSRDFAATQDRIRQAAIETARAIRDAAAAMDQFKGKQAQGKVNIASQEEALAFNQMAAGSGLPQAQINFISTLENRLEALNIAIRDMARAMDEADQSAARLKATTEFRTMAAGIEAGARDISRFGAATDTAAISGQRFADTIQGILAPASAASTSLEGINAVLVQAESVTEGAKRRVSEYNAELNNLQSASAGIAAIAKLTDDFARQEGVVAAARAEMDRAQAEVIQLATAMRTSAAPTQEMANALKQAEASLETAGRAFQTESGKLTVLDAKLKKAGVDSRDLAAAQNQLAGAANRVAAAQQKASNATGGTGAFMGLRPHEMQNLGFQVNDIIVSIASGQAPMRVFLQQGAQIGQIIPGAFSAIIRFAGPLAALAAVVLTFAAAMKKASDEARNMAIVTSITAQMGDGIKTSAAEFANLADQMAKAGVKGEELRGILVNLAADGLSTAEMQDYIETAKAVAEVTGVEMAEALEKVREHFQGGMSDILALDEAENIYNATQLQTIQNLFDQGKAEEARTYALQIYKQNQQSVADLQRGPWKIATEQMSEAWQRFLNWLNTDGPFKNVQTNLSNMARGAAYLAALMNEISKGNFAGAHAAAKKTATADLMPKPKAAGGGGGGGVKPSAALREARLELETARATTPVQKRNLELKKLRNEAADKGLKGLEKEAFINTKMATFQIKEDERAAKASTKAGKSAAAAARKREAAARAAAKRAEAEGKRIENMEEGLVRSLDALDAKVGKGSGDVEAQVRAITSEYKKLFDAIDDYEAKRPNGLIGDRSADEAREHVRLQKIQLENKVRLKAFEEDIGKLESERSERLDRIADQVERGIIKPEDGLVQSKAVLDEMAGRISQMALAGIAFAASIRGANPSPELLALISKFETAAQNNSGGQNARATSSNARDAIDAQEQNLNNILSARNDLIEVEMALVGLSLQSRKQAEQNIQAEFANSRKGILDQIAAIRAMRDAYKGELTPAMSAYFAALEGRLKIAATQVEYTSESFTNLRSQMNEILTSNIVGFIDSIAQAFARLATGQESALGVLEAIGRAFLEMIANILKTVAMLIIQALILNAVDKLTGGILKPLLQVTAAATKFHSGGVVGNNGSSSRKGNVNPLAFANAPVYHSGGIAGLAPDEVGAILKKNEEVLTKDDPRHRFNGGMNPAGGSAPTGIRQILAIGDDEIAGAMSGAAGEKTMLTHIRRNKATIKQMLDA